MLYLHPFHTHLTTRPYTTSPESRVPGRQLGTGKQPSGFGYNGWTFHGAGIGGGSVQYLPPLLGQEHNRRNLYP